MADTKLSDLSAITAAASNDIFYVVDVSDTTDDAAGSSKKITLSNLQDDLTITISQISDLDTGSVTFTNKTIDADNNTISNIALGAEATGAINDLSDVTITTLSSNELLFTQDGSTWVNQTLAEAGIQAQDAFLDDIAALTDPGANAAIGWDDTAGAVEFLTQAELSALVDHDQTTNFASNEHFTQASITTVGTVTSGTWQATDVGVAHGGTGASDAAGAKTNLGFMTDLTDDASPQLAANLDASSYDITSVGKLDYDYATSLVTALGSMGTTETIDWSTGTVFTGTLDADITITHSNEGTGQRITLLFSYDSTAQRTITWSDVDKWIGGSAPTAPSASGEVLVVTLTFDGTTCYGDGGVAS